MRIIRILPLILTAALLLPALPASAEESTVRIIEPPCRAELQYTVGTVSILLDERLAGAQLSLYRTQLEGEFLYYFYETGLPVASVVRCGLFEGDYLLKVSIPSAETAGETLTFELPFTISDPDMDKEQSFDTTSCSFSFTFDETAEKAQAFSEPASLTERTIRQTGGLILPQRGARPGDLSGDGNVDTTDAALLLIESALIGAGNTSSFTALQTVEADVNGDGFFDSTDAAYLLSYAADRATGLETGSLPDYLLHQSIGNDTPDA